MRGIILVSALLFFLPFSIRANHQYCTTARVVCSISDAPSEGSLCNSSCSGNNNLVNGSNSCFSGGLTRWGFYMFSIEQSGTLTFTINPDPPSFFDDGDYNFALFDVSNGCGSLGNAIRCSKAYNSSDPAANTGLNMGSNDTTEGSGGDGWLKYLNAQCGHTYILCLDIPGNDGNGFSLSFGGSCTFGAPAGFSASSDTVCAGDPVTFSLNCNVSNAFITYSWNFGANATPSTFTGMTPPPVTFSTNGAQTVTLTSTFTAGSSCTKSSSQTVFVTNAAPTSDFTVTSPVCQGNNVMVTYTGNGSSNATYNWNFDGGNIISVADETYTISWATAGTYIVTLDVTECATTSAVTADTVVVAASPVAYAGPDDTICSGKSTALSATGGTAYSWLPSTGLSCTNCQSPNANPTVTTPYVVAVMDAFGCQDWDTVVIKVNTLPPANAGNDVSICNGGSTNLNASGGVTYSWSPPTALSNANVANPSANPSSSTTYTVTVTDANSCSNTDAVVVTVNMLPVADAGPPVSICNGNSTTLNASGGTSYLWSPPTGLSSTTVANPSANPTTTTPYTVTVTDSNTCTDTDTVTVTVNTVPAANAGNDVAICSGDSTTLGASGGTGYSWSPATGLSNPNISNPIAFPSSTTTYTVTVSNTFCSKTDDITVTVNSNPVGSILSQNNVSCYNGNNGNATIGVTNGTTPYSYLWNPTFQTTQTGTGLIAGTYTVYIADANTCTTSVSITITQPAAFTASVTKTDVTCYGYGNGSATASVNGGIPSYTYLWLPGGGTGALVTGLTSGSYTVVVSDANGCTTSSTVTITQPTVLGVTASATDVACFGLCNGTATAAGSGGTSPYTFDWSNGAMNSVTATGLCTGTYSVFTTDANGCTTTAAVAVNEPPLLETSTSSVSNVLCYGQCNGSVVTGTTGGTLPYTYNWSGGGSGSLCAGTFTVTVTDNNGCTDTAAATITQPAALAAANSVTNITCFGQCNGTIAATVSGGTTSYSYNWNNGATADSTGALCSGTYTVTVTDGNGCTITTSGTITQPSAIGITHLVTDIKCTELCEGIAAEIATGGISPYTYLWSAGGTENPKDSLCAGSYSVTVYDGNGCTTIDYFSVIINKASTVTVTGDTISCNKDGAQISAYGGVSYQWSPATGLSATNVNDPVATPDSGTIYTVIMTDQYGCKDTGYIKVIASTVVANAGADMEINYGNSNPLTATGGGTYNWFPAAGLSCTGCQSPVASPEENTTYSVEVVNSYGCRDTDDVTVTVNVSDVIFVPDIFSPNGDNKNDVLYVRGPSIKELFFAVYDRWGEKVFETTDKTKGWNGEFHGQPADAAVYVYYVKATLVNRNIVKLKGDVTLVR